MSVPLFIPGSLPFVSLLILAGWFLTRFLKGKIHPGIWVERREWTCYIFAIVPTIEFNGYTVDEAERICDRVRGRLADLPFCQDIVFVKRGPSQVIAWDGSERPFIRVLTRMRERADRIRDRLTSECDLEIVLIDFIPRATG